MTRTFTAFQDEQRIAAGSLDAVLEAMAGAGRGVLVFDDATGELMKLNTQREIAATRSEDQAPTGPPVAVTVNLPPRQAAWLQAQPEGPAAVMRRLVEAARRTDDGRPRRAKEAGYRFLSMLAGDYPGFEEAVRALFAGDAARYEAAAAAWPADVRVYGRDLAAAAFS